MQYYVQEPFVVKAKIMEETHINRFCLALRDNAILGLLRAWGEEVIPWYRPVLQYPPWL